MIENWLVFFVLIAVALVFVLIPLWAPRRQRDDSSQRTAENIALYRDKLRELEAERQSEQISEAEYSQLKLEFDRLLLQETTDSTQGSRHSVSSMKWLSLVLLIALPVSSVTLYWTWGAGQDIELIRRMESLQAGEINAAQIEVLLSDLERRAEQLVDNDQYWSLLASSYMELQQYQAAARSYQRLVQLFPEDSETLALYVQAMYLGNGRQLTPELQTMVDRALGLDPQQKTLLGLLGMDAYDKGRHGEAIEYWSRLLAVYPADSTDRQFIQGSIEQARLQQQRR